MIREVSFMKRIWIFLFCTAFLVLTVSAVQALQETAIVMSFAGDVKITPVGEVKAVQCEPGMALKSGDKITTGEESYLEVAFDRPKGNIVRIEENSYVIIRLKGTDSIELIDGEILALLRNLKGGETFQVRTPCGVCGARGTGLGTNTDGSSMNVGSFEGKVFTRGVNRDGSVMEDDSWVDEGYERTIKKFGKPGKMTKMSEEKLKKMKSKFKQFQKSKMGKKSSKFNQMMDKEERRREGLLEKKDEKRLDKIRDDKKDTSSSGGQRETSP
jgi:hypothetical protein